MSRIFIFLLLVTLNAKILLGQATEAKVLGTWSDSTIIGSNAHNNKYNEIWGLAINGHEYAIIGSTQGTHLIDVTDPKAPFEAYFIGGRTTGGQIIHRDYHDYQGYLYSVADEGGNSLQIIDCRNLPNPPYVITHDAFARAHNIFIDSTHARLYTLSRSVGIFDISNPLNPVEIGRYRPDGGVHDGYIEDHIGFINIGGSGLVVVDFTNPSTPEVINSLTEYPARGYNHSGWVNQNCSTYYFADETHGSPLKAMDISNLCDLEVGKTFDAQVANPSSIAHNLIAACDYLYVSYYYDGLRVYDISDPLNPSLVRYFDTFLSADRTRYEGAWGVYPFLPSGNILLSDMQSGLFVFENMGDNCNESARRSSCLRNQICTVTSTENETIFNAVNVQPNPAQDQTSLIVNLSTAIDNLTLTLSNLNGQVLQNWSFQGLNPGKNDLSILLPKSLSQGLYFLSLRGEQIHLTKKLLIEPHD